MIDGIGMELVGFASWKRAAVPAEKALHSRLQRQSKHSQTLINCPSQHTYILCACNIMIVEVCLCKLVVSTQLDHYQNCYSGRRVHLIAEVCRPGG